LDGIKTPSGSSDDPLVISGDRTEGAKLWFEQFD